MAFLVWPFRTLLEALDYITGVFPMSYITGPGASVSGDLLSFTDATGLVAEDSGINVVDVTQQGNSFNVANKLVQLDGAGALPILNGANLTGVVAGWPAAGADLVPHFDPAALQTTTPGFTFDGANLSVPGDIFAGAGTLHGTGLAIAGQLGDGVYTLGSGDQITITNGVITALS